MQLSHFVSNVGMRGPKGNDFSAILVINRVLISVMLVNGLFHSSLGPRGQVKVKVKEVLHWECF